MSFNKIEILKNNDVKIDEQFIGKINGLKLALDLKKGALDTDIKSLKKAARQTIGPELEKRIQIIIDTGLNAGNGTGPLEIISICDPTSDSVDCIISMASLQFLSTSLECLNKSFIKSILCFCTLIISSINTFSCSPKTRLCISFEKPK